MVETATDGAYVVCFVRSHGGGEERRVWMYVCIGAPCSRGPGKQAQPNDGLEDEETAADSFVKPVAGG